MNCTGLYWTVLDCIGLYWTVLDFIGLYWTVLGCTRLCLAEQVVQIVQVVQVVRVVRMTSLDDMHSENIWFASSKPSNYQEKLRCHACDTRRNDGGKWKIEQYSGRPETAI